MPGTWLLCWPLLALTAVSWAPCTARAAPAESASANCPAPASAARAPAGPRYLLASAADILVLLPPPPAADSAAQQDDLRAVLQAQRDARSAGTVAHALADVQADCGRFADVIGEALTSPSDAQVLAFLNRAALEAATVVGPAKTYWHRLRPYAYSPEVEALGDMAPASKAPDIDTQERSNCPSMPAGPEAAAALAHSSYPSGHATFGTVCAILLAQMVPEKRAQLFARSLDYGHSRLVMGAHFPSDVLAGRIAGTVAAQLLMQNPQFQHDFSEGRSSLRQLLGLAQSGSQPPAAGR